jgi:SAM-dependent methyltransferase
MSAVSNDSAAGVNAPGGGLAPGWLDSPLGRYLVAAEQAHFDRAVADRFGYHAVQVGLAGVDLLRESRMPLRVHVGREPGADVRADPLELPFAEQCIDLLVLAHVLEFSADPHQILREASRVLMPEGHLIISGMNPWSLWGIRRSLAASPRRRPAAPPWTGEFISLLRLKDWLTLLDFEICGGRMGCYAPPFSGAQWLRRFGFMDRAGDRWWPFAGGVYFLTAVKRVRGMRVIVPRWAGRALRQRRLVVVPSRITGRRAVAPGWSAANDRVA